MISNSMIKALCGLWTLYYLVILTGCASTPDQHGQGNQRTEEKAYHLSLPKGWMNFSLDEDDEGIIKEGLILFLSRDGIDLQAINLKKHVVGAELAHTKMTFQKNMLPQELTEVSYDNAKSNPRRSHFTLIENSPAKIGELTGYKLSYSYHIEAGLQKRDLCYGVLEGEVHYSLCYSAPVRHYFEKDLEIFETVKDSFVLKKKVHQPHPPS